MTVKTGLIIIFIIIMENMSFCYCEVLVFTKQNAVMTYFEYALSVNNNTTILYHSEIFIQLNTLQVLLTATSGFRCRLHIHFNN